MKRKEESSVGQKPGSKEARSGVFRGWKESGVVSEWVHGGSTHLHGGKWKWAGLSSCSLSHRTSSWSLSCGQPQARGRFAFRKNHRGCSGEFRAMRRRGRNHLGDDRAIPMRDGEFQG